MIVQITKKEELPEYLDVIHRSFKTVAEEFGHLPFTSGYLECRL